MEPSWWLPLLGFALVTCGTPGPNNMLLTSAGANLGVRRSLPMLFAVVGGLNLLILATAMGLGVLFSQWPLMHLLLKGAGSLYLLWLAWKLAWAAPPDGTRITSYNVCYTKLLRLGTRRPRRAPDLDLRHPSRGSPALDQGGRRFRADLGPQR